MRIIVVNVATRPKTQTIVSSVIILILLTFCFGWLISDRLAPPGYTEVGHSMSRAQVVKLMGQPEAHVSITELSKHLRWFLIYWRPR